jgi:dihydrofolate reductase
MGRLMSAIILPHLTAVVAMASNRVIGHHGSLPWHLPADLKHFKSLTLGHPILMGRKTYESIGRPLPKRRNLVLSRTLEPTPGVEIVRTIEELASLFSPQEQVFLIGGAELFAALLPACQELYLTWIERAYEGDSFMPEFESFFQQHEVIGSAEGMEFRRYTRLA